MALKNMINDLKTIQEKSDYTVKEDKIAYKDQDGYSTSIIYGYKTMFLYFVENQKKNITDSSLEANICLNLNCGSFSFAEIPKIF